MKKLDLEKISDLYLNERKPSIEIARIFGVSGFTILNRLKKLGIKRTIREAKKINLDLWEIKNLYVNHRKTVKQIAQIFNVGETVIYYRLKKLGVIKKRGEIIKLKLDFDKIRDLYVNQKKSSVEIGKILGVSWLTIINRLKENNIKMRSISETNKILYQEGKLKIWNNGLTKETNEIVRKGTKKSTQTRKKLYKEGKLKSWNKNKSMIHSGSFKKAEGHPFFNNWSSREPYGKEFSPELKEQIRKRDNYTCQECGKTQKKLKQNKSNYNKKLRIHHIDYNKQNNIPLNLISLCLNCHSKTNNNRKHWERCFKERMALREIFNPENLLVFNENKQLIGVNKI